MAGPFGLGSKLNAFTRGLHDSDREAEGREGGTSEPEAHGTAREESARWTAPGTHHDVDRKKGDQRQRGQGKKISGEDDRENRRGTQGAEREHEHGQNRPEPGVFEEGPDEAIWLRGFLAL